MLYPKKGISDIPPMDGDAVEAKYFVRPEQYSDLAALVGETADNLPGVPGVGPKTAAKWINLYGGLEGIFANIDSIKGKVGESLREHVEDVKRNRHLNHLLRDLELPVAIEAMELERPDREAIEELFDALEFTTLRKRLFDLFGEEPEEAREEKAIAEHQLLGNAEELTSWFASHGAVLLGMHPVSDEVSGGVVGLAFAANDANAYVSLEDIDAETQTGIGDSAVLGELRQGRARFQGHLQVAGQPRPGTCRGRG